MDNIIKDKGIYDYAFNEYVKLIKAEKIAINVMNEFNKEYVFVENQEMLKKCYLQYIKDFIEKYNFFPDFDNNDIVPTHFDVEKLLILQRDNELKNVQDYYKEKPFDARLYNEKNRKNNEICDEYYKIMAYSLKYFDEIEDNKVKVK